MSLLTICQDAADEIGITRPSTIASNTSDEAFKLLRYANRVGYRLMKAVPWQILRAEQTFTALAGETQTGILPDDFDRFIPETFWDRTNTTLVIGPVSSVEWNGLKANSYSDSTARKFILRGGAVSALPAFSGGESLAYEYVKNTWAQSSGDAAQTKFQADTDTSLIDEELLTLGVIFEYLDGEGQPSQRAAVAYEERFGVLLKNDQPTAGVMLSADIFGGARRFSGAPPTNGAFGNLWS